MERVRLTTLFADVVDAQLPPEAERLRVGSVRDDSRAVRPGDVFVAVPGRATDGVAHVADAVGRGAAAVVAERTVEAAVPVVRVNDARLALAELAAASFGHPARALSIAGITGTVGKTSVLVMLGAILDAAGIAAGTIGSLGIRYDHRTDPGPNTTPGALVLQRALAGMRDAGRSIAALEVTSHAIAQRRVHGIAFDLGVFTNLTMLEHLEYHGSFREYANVKLRFLDHLRPDAPLIHSAGDRVVRQAARRHTGPRISCGGGRSRVCVRREALSFEGTRLTVNVRKPLPRLDGSCVEPVAFPLELRTLGRPNTSNATLAAAAALCLGAAPEHVRQALARIEPPKRRMQVIRRLDPIIIDDTVGHPDSITAIFELVSRVRRDALRVVFAIRGRRGPVINARDAEALSIWSRRVPVDRIFVTSAVDVADERNTVSRSECRAFLDVLRRCGPAHEYHTRLESAVGAALEHSRGRDVVLLLGAQGMDAGAAIAARWIEVSRAGSRG